MPYKDPAKRAEWLAKNIERVRANGREYSKAHPKGKKFWREYYRTHKESYNAAAVKWQKKNPEKVREYFKRWYDKNRRKPTKPKQTIAEKNARQRKYYKKHQKKMSTLLHKYRARRMKSPGAHTTAQWLAVIAMQENLCFYCKIFLNDEILSKDHKIPLIRGGSNDIENIVAACLRCNKRKRTKTAEEFLSALNHC